MSAQEQDPNEIDGGQGSLLTQEAVAARWDLSPRTIEGWRSRGVGPAWVRIGRCVRYRLSDLLAYEDEQRWEPAAESAAKSHRSRP